MRTTRRPANSAPSARGTSTSTVPEPFFSQRVQQGDVARSDDREHDGEHRVARGGQCERGRAEEQELEHESPDADQVPPRLRRPERRPRCDGEQRSSDAERDPRDRTVHGREAPVAERREDAELEQELQREARSLHGEAVHSNSRYPPYQAAATAGAETRAARRGRSKRGGSPSPRTARTTSPRAARG